ncbi:MULTISPECIES: AraC family transcriptional regulator [unclassified Amycolatopsis]|uniref:AraC family transcriptional regulator n=1 Tax=unclassified Amycolatopsis TaxID=2618356 RepID=UPI001C697E6B|nr:AraC family transcriptional regulator [Amycolatopsis sp. DSM 110486]QYN20241.1 AraC family transcriptional regulator [Amycolatopsis sp. DSM 110486]
MFDALTDEQSAVARLRLCSRRDNGWLTPLVQLVDNAPATEQFDLPATSDIALVLVTQGRTTMESWHGGHWRRVECQPGRIRVTAPGRPVRLRWRGDDGYLTTNVFLSPSLLERAAVDLRRPAAARMSWPDILTIDDPVLAAVSGGLGDAALAGADPLYAETAAAYLAAHLLTRHGRLPAPRPASGEDIRVRRAVSFINENHHLPLALTDIAAAASLSPFHFLRVFKRATGQTPHRFLTTVRVNRARRYLERGDISVTEVAQLCGFASPAQLATSFRRETGLSPSAYRADRNKSREEPQADESADGPSLLTSPACPQTT